jgi:HEAT repeat protein
LGLNQIEMGFYNLSKEERAGIVKEINLKIYEGLLQDNRDSCAKFFSDPDTYIRKTAYLAIGKIFLTYPDLEDRILNFLNSFLYSEDEKVRQTSVNAAGEIGKTRFDLVEYIMDFGLKDQHPTVRNAVIGSIKKMGEKNPTPILSYAKNLLDHPDKEVRREICHGIELRGRTHPQDILPLLKVLQFDKTSRVKKTLVHVLGQISYKKGCLQTVVQEVKNWDNKQLVKEALMEIVDVHGRYKNFAFKTQQQAIDYIENEMAGYLN